MLRKNVAGQHVFFGLINATTGAALTGATVAGHMGLDAAAQAAVNGTFTEMGLGQYRFDPAAADTNANFVGYLFSAASAIPVNANFITTGGNFSDGVAFGLSSLPAVAAGASGGLATIDASLRTLANVGAWNGHAVPAENVNGVPKVDCVDFLGQAVVLDANNLVKVDVADWAATIVSALPLNFGNLAVTAGGAVTVGANNDKTGYSLAASGLDQISVADPGGIAGQTTLPKLIVALWRRFFKKSTLTSTQLKTYADDGATVNVTQAVSDDGTTQTQGAGN